MEAAVEATVKYRLLISEGPQNEEYWRELKKKAKECGAINITRISAAEVMIRGENGPIAELAIWLLAEPRLKKLRHLKPA